MFKEVAMTCDYGHLMPDNNPRHLTQIKLKYSFTTLTPLIRIVAMSHPDMQKVRIIGFFFENRLH